MNATALAVNVSTLIDNFGNSVVYYPPKDSTTYNSEGDWTPTYQTTTVSTKWIESDNINKRTFEELGKFQLRENEVVMKGTVNVAIRGKCVSNSISWEIDQIKPVRIKDQTVANIVLVKQILP